MIIPPKIFFKKDNQQFSDDGQFVKKKLDYTLYNNIKKKLLLFHIEYSMEEQQTISFSSEV